MCVSRLCAQGSSRTVRKRPVLGRVIRRADTVAAVWQRTQRIALRCQGRSQKGIKGAMSPNRRLSGFFLRKNWLCWDVGPALFSTVKFCRRRLKRSSTFLRKNALALSFCSNQCKILATPLCIAGRRRGNAIVPIGNNGK